MLKPKKTKNTLEAKLQKFGNGLRKNVKRKLEKVYAPATPNPEAELRAKLRMNRTRKGRQQLLDITRKRTKTVKPPKK